MYYYISIGSNISPKQNFSKILTWLVKQYGCLVVYPIVETQPEALDTEHVFLNTLCIMYSEQDKTQVKSLFNQQEEILGRDRSDPMRSHKDRTADIDILDVSEQFEAERFQDFPEQYIQQVLQSKNNVVTIDLGDLFLGDRPSTIYFDRTTGQIRIINNKLDGLDDWVKARFVTE